MLSLVGTSGSTPKLHPLVRSGTSPVPGPRYHDVNVKGLCGGKQARELAKRKASLFLIYKVTTKTRPQGLNGSGANLPTRGPER